MATKRNGSGDRSRNKRRRASDVGRMVGELEGRAARGRGRLWTETQPPNVKTGKVCA